MNAILFDDQYRDNLLPLTYTRPVSEIRTGILTIREKWGKYSGLTFSNICPEYLSQKFPLVKEADNLLINAALLPTAEMADEIMNLKKGDFLFQKDRLLACRIDRESLENFNPAVTPSGNSLRTKCDCRIIDFPWQIFKWNGEEIESDFRILTRNRECATLSKTNNLIHPENIFAEEGFRGEYVTINASAGPVYLGRNSEIMENSTIRGPFSLGEGSTLKLAAKIYGPTTIGPHSKVGGEVNNSVIFGFSNKAHDGFLGNSVIGEWCNIGADSNNSNLKNNYAEVKLWNYPAGKFIPTGEQFCGLIMGDHSKCGINTMFNTGTVVGVNANIFGSGFPRNFIPSFSWGGAGGFTTYSTSKAFEVAKEVMRRRDIEFTDEDREILLEIFRLSEKYRK